jgi:hypothetical protein
MLQTTNNPLNFYVCTWRKRWVNSLLAIKKSCDSLLAIKKINFPIGHWVQILFLIGHPSIKVGEQMSFWPSRNIINVNCVLGIISLAKNVILIDALHSLQFHLKNTAHIIFDDAMFNLMTFLRKKYNKNSHPVIMSSGKSKSKTN